MCELFFCTTAHKLKQAAKPKGLVNKITRTNVLPGGHVSDEADMLSLPTVIAASAKDRWLLVPCDPAQHMVGVNTVNRGRDVGSLAREQSPNDRLGFCEKVVLSQTRRFGPRGKALLQAMVPEHYEHLECSPDAPDTHITYIDLGYVEWTQAINRAGGVVNHEILARVAHCTRELLKAGDVMILCIYACTRDLVAAYLRDAGFEVTVKARTDVDAAVPLVVSARQSTGGARLQALALFF